MVKCTKGTDRLRWRGAEKVLPKTIHCSIYRKTLLTNVTPTYCNDRYFEQMVRSINDFTGKCARLQHDRTHAGNCGIESEAEDLVGRLEFEHGVDQVCEVPKEHVRVVHLQYHTTYTQKNTHK